MPAYLCDNSNDNDVGNDEGNNDDGYNKKKDLK